MRLASIKTSILALAVFSIPFLAPAALVDTDGNPATNDTYLGDIDMAVGTVGDLTTYISTGAVEQAVTQANAYTDTKTAAKQDKLPYPTNAIPYAAISGTPNLATVATSGSYNDLSDKPDIPTVPTNVSAFNNDAGYVDKSVTNGLLSTSTAAATYQPKGDYALVSALAAAAAAATNHTDTSVAAAATASTNYTDSTVADAATAATNYTDSAAVAAVSTAVSTSKAYTDTSTNAVIQHVDAMDTSYFRFETITNVNQSVQYVATDANTTELRILMPATGMTKDWLVYIYPAADLNIVLPGPADYWCSSYDVTNSIPAGVPTALYFSQITEGVFSLGRKKLDCPITVSSPLTAKLRAAQAANRRAALTARRPPPTATALKTAAKPAATAAKPTAAAVKPATTNTTATATAPAKK